MDELLSLTLIFGSDLSLNWLLDILINWSFGLAPLLTLVHLLKLWYLLLSLRVMRHVCSRRFSLLLWQISIFTCSLYFRPKILDPLVWLSMYHNIILHFPVWKFSAFFFLSYRLQTHCSVELSPPFLKAWVGFVKTAVVNDSLHLAQSLSLWFHLTVCLKNCFWI